MVDAPSDCGCEDWAKSMPYINGAMFQFVNHGAKPYSGKRFIFCPWCGTRILGEDGVASQPAESDDG